MKSILRFFRRWANRQRMDNWQRGYKWARNAPPSMVQMHLDMAKTFRTWDAFDDGARAALDERKRVVVP